MSAASPLVSGVMVGRRPTIGAASSVTVRRRPTNAPTGDVKADVGRQKLRRQASGQMSVDILPRQATSGRMSAGNQRRQATSGRMSADGTLRRPMSGRLAAIARHRRRVSGRLRARGRRRQRMPGRFRAVGSPWRTVSARWRAVGRLRRRARRAGGTGRSPRKRRAGRLPASREPPGCGLRIRMNRWPTAR